MSDMLMSAQMPRQAGGKQAKAPVVRSYECSECGKMFDSRRRDPEYCDPCKRALGLLHDKPVRVVTPLTADEYAAKVLEAKGKEPRWKGLPRKAPSEFGSDYSGYNGLSVTASNGYND